MNRTPIFLSSRTYLRSWREFAAKTNNGCSRHWLVSDVKRGGEREGKYAYYTFEMIGHPLCNFSTSN